MRGGARRATVATTTVWREKLTSALLEVTGVSRLSALSPTVYVAAPWPTSWGYLEQQRNRQVAYALACTRRRGAGECEREREPEGGALTRDTVQSDVAVVRLDDALADVQSEAHADAGAALHRGARDDGETLPDLLVPGTR